MLGNYRNSKLNERYRNDSTFHSIVNAMYSMIAEHGVTPSELREAMFLAHYRYEMENPKAVTTRNMLNMSELHGLEAAL